MTHYLMPGVTMTPPKSRVTGAACVILAAIVIAVGSCVANSSHDERMHVAVYTDQLADGVQPGTTVRARGIAIGQVTAVGPSSGHLSLDLALDRDALTEFDDSLGIDFVPANLFGISEVELTPGPGGTALSDGATIDLTGPRAPRVFDATMSALLRQFSDAVGGVLTPQLASMLQQLSQGISVFTPLLRIIIALAEAVADTQRLPASFLAGEYGRTLHGTGEFTAATVEVFDVIRDNRPLREDRPHFDATVDAIVNNLLPAAVGLGSAGEQYLGDYIGAVVPVLQTVSMTVPRPAQSAGELRELLLRLDRVFANGTGGPVLQASVAVRGVPVLAQGLFGSAMNAPGPEGR